MKKTTLNNKGFSLVELIIVVAIMAVLIGVLAPVFLQYLEKTNKSTDVNAVTDIMYAMEVAMIEQAADGDSHIENIIIKFDNNGQIDYSDTTNTAGISTVKGIVGDYTLKGDWTEMGATDNSATITAKYAAGRVQFTVTNSVDAMYDNFGSVKDRIDRAYSSL